MLFGKSWQKVCGKVLYEEGARHKRLAHEQMNETRRNAHDIVMSEGHISFTAEFIYKVSDELCNSHLPVPCLGSMLTSCHSTSVNRALVLKVRHAVF